MGSGEKKSIAIKHKTATCQQWKIHGMLAGNEVANWVDNSGSVSRRVVVFAFKERVWDGDPKLFDKLQDELPALIMKSNWAYREAAKEHGDKEIWNVLPEYFKRTQQELRANTHALAAFLTYSDKLVFDSAAYIPFHILKRLLTEYCLQNHLKQRNMTPDFMSSVFEEWGLSIETGVTKEYRGVQCPVQVWVLGVDQVPDVVQQVQSN